MIKEILTEIQEETNLNDKLISELELYLTNNESDTEHMFKLKDLICNIVKTVRNDNSSL